MTPEDKEYLSGYLAGTVAGWREYRIVALAELACILPVYQIAKLTGDREASKAASQAIAETLSVIEGVELALRNWAQ